MNHDLIWIVLVVVVAAAGLYLSTRAGARGREDGRAQGRREAELEAAPLRDRAAEAERRLTETETRLEAVRGSLQEALNRKSALETEAARLPLVEKSLRDLQASASADGLELQSARTELQILRESTPRNIEAMRQELSSLSEKIFKEKSSEFTALNKASLEQLLNPLKTDIKAFELKVEASRKDGDKQHTELKTQIEMLYKMNDSLGQEAKNLTIALKGENKTGGNWGEVILERVLEVSGLEKGREYKVQESMLNDEGRRKQPDAIVFLPSDRHLVIDSKLSLLAYERYCSAESAEASKEALQAHVQSVRQHVKNLSEQGYHDLPGLDTPDFVFLFMPIEPAFIEAVKRDGSLFQEAFEKNIIIVSPSTLLATLRTVANIWKHEYRSQHVAAIAKQAGDLYDKFVGFLEDLEGIGEALNKAQTRFDGAKKKLSEGRDNLVGKVERIRKFGAKTKKRIPLEWIEDAEDGVEGDDPPVRDQGSLSLD